LTQGGFSAKIAFLTTNCFLMTMHLEGPWLSTSGKKKGKVKFRNAAEAKRARELADDWQQLQQRWGVEQQEKKRRRAMAAEPLVYKLETPVGRTNTKHIPSKDTGGVAVLKPSQMYSGTEMLGIGQLHKSNAVPVFRQQDAEDIARMRR
jgi:hypothetical protein